MDVSVVADWQLVSDMTALKTKNTNGVVVLQCVLALALGGLLIYAAVPKLLEPTLFFWAVDNYVILPEWGSYVVALVLPWVELFCGITLIAWWLGRLLRRVPVLKAITRPGVFHRVAPLLTIGLLLTTGLVVWLGAFRRESMLLTIGLALVFAVGLLLTIALAFCLGAFRRGGLLLTIGLALAFAAGIVSVWARGIDINCGCFGNSDEPSNYPLHIALNLGMATAAVILWKFAPKPAPQGERPPAHH